MASTTLQDVDEQLKDVIHNLYAIMVQSYDYHGQQTASAMTNEVKALVTNLTSLTHASRALTTALPAEVVEYVENGRNPDIYMRDFVEAAQRLNQQLKGKSEAFAAFRDALAREISGGIPECKPDVDKVIESAAGNKKPS